MTDPQTQLEGRLIDFYRLRKWLGDGESSVVFLTDHDGRDAAIRLVSVGEGENDLLSQWHDAATLSHPRLQNIFGSGRFDVDGIPFAYVVTEYADEVLSDVLPERPLTAAETRDVLEGIIPALDYLHQRGYVHGRVTPANLLAIGDLVKLSSDSIRKPALMREATQEDIRELGRTIVEMLTQTRPLGEEPEGLPDPFGDIVRRCLAVDPRQQWTASEILTRLEGKSPNRTQVSAAQSALPEPEAIPVLNEPPAAKRPFPIYALLATVIGLILLVVWVMRNRQDGTGTTAAPIRIATATDPVPAGDGPPAPIKTDPGTTPPRLVEEASPDILPQAAASIRGKVTVVIRITIDEVGNPGRASISSGAGNRYFAKVAIQTAQRSRFASAKKNGRNTTGDLRLRYDFTNKETTVTAAK